MPEVLINYGTRKKSCFCLGTEVEVMFASLIIRGLTLILIKSQGYEYHIK